MHLSHLVAAADDSEEGRNAILAAAHLAQQCGARVTVLTVTDATTADGAAGPRVLEGLRGIVTRTLASLPHPPSVDLGVSTGLPAIEISRFAEDHEADLVVIGRKRRTEMQRMLIGDTADAVARRCRTPCLFVPAGELRLQRLLVALDGSERGLSVLAVGLDLARDLAARVRAVTVEPAYENEIGVTPLLTGRSERLLEAIEDLRRTTDLGRGRWESGREIAGGGKEGAPVVVHRGRVVEAIIGEVTGTGADVLVVGYRRGGPAAVIDAGSIARRLTHEAPCAVLTVPL